MSVSSSGCSRTIVPGAIENITPLVAIGVCVPLQSFQYLGFILSIGLLKKISMHVYPQ